jgi:hypothetical protein
MNVDRTDRRAVQPPTERELLDALDLLDAGLADDELLAQLGPASEAEPDILAA